MDRQAAVKIIRDTFENPFDKGRFINFGKNLVNYLDTSKNFTYQGNIIPDAYERSIQSLERIGKYEDADDNKIDVLIVRLKREYSLERARTMQRNFVAWYLNGSRGGELKDAALVAFVSPDDRDWRFSLIKMEYDFSVSSGKPKLETLLTPARRYSFLVGENESSHTAQVQLLPILENDKSNPLLSDLEKAFSIEVVTKEFFRKYRELFHEVEEALQEIVEKDKKVREDFAAKGVDTINFSKKLLGQIVFLYFLQKKGWFGVGRDEDWGTGPKNFLRLLFQKKVAPYQNFFNDVLEPLFYEALALERADDFYSRFNCKIPFLNGGLFDPINNYDWVHTDILLPNELFSNSQKTKEGDVGTGILDVFDRYNFTVKEDEPLDKEVAIDPEMLGQVFENLLEVKDRKSKGTYYTPREIVHYMCQESLINYLDTATNTGDVPLVRTPFPQGKLFGKPDPEQTTFKTPSYRVLVPREDIEAFVRMGEFAIEHDSRVETYGKETERYSYKLPEIIRFNAKLIDEKLANVRVCDPAIGSGAFPVGLMTEIIRARNTLTTYLADKEGRTNYNFKRHAIQNCLYGVDIDPGAVEIAKLRLWLSLVVDEEDIKQIQPLPNLDYKIVCGNSLLGVEKTLFNLDLFKELERLKSLYFKETSAKKKQAFKSEIDNLINQITDNNQNFDFEVYFSEVFHEKGGFDVVIANPPYIDYRDIPKEIIKAVSNYKTNANSQRPNLYMYFIEKGFCILKANGIFLFINPNQFLSINAGLGLRKFILENTTIRFIIDVSYIKVFQESATYTTIWLYVKNSLPDYKIRINACDDLNKLEDTTFYLTKKEVLSDPSRIIPIHQDYKLLLKIEDGHPRLGTLCNMIWGTSQSGYGKQKIDKSEYFKLSDQQKKGYKPILQTSDIKRYYIEWQGEYIPQDIYSDNAKLVFGQKDKILIARVTRRLQCAIDNECRFVGKATVLFNCKVDRNYLLGVLNSKLINHWYSKKFETVHMASGYLRFDIPYLEQTPIVNTASMTQEHISEAVNKILAITKDEDYLSNPTKQAKVKEYEHQIDQMVYELYGLTPEEIAVVEGITKE